MGTHDKRVSRKLYRIKGSNLTVSELPPSGFRFGDADFFMVVRPGLEHSTVEPALEHVVEFATRIAPWVELYLGPRVISETGERWGGLCHQSAGVVFVSTRTFFSSLMEILFHELFHAVDYYLSPADRAVLDAAVGRGADYASDYLSDPAERRARLFEHFATYIYEGGRLLVHPDAPEVALLWKIYSGEIGQGIYEGMRSFDDIAAA